MRRRRGGRVCVRGGGHSAPGHSCIDDAVVIDLGSLREVVVDAQRATARVGGGALWSDVDRATAAHGLATTGGLISHTGVGGLTLGGGIGWLMRKHGLAIDNLVGAEVVLADGRVVNASSDENADLFWALRGGGGNFGVVTRFDFRLHPVRNVLAGMVMYPMARAREMLRFFREQTAAAPDELTALFAFMLAPPAPFIPPALHGAPMARSSSAGAAIRRAAPRCWRRCARSGRRPSTPSARCRTSRCSRCSTPARRAACATT